MYNKRAPIYVKVSPRALLKYEESPILASLQTKMLRTSQLFFFSISVPSEVDFSLEVRDRKDAYINRNLSCS